LNEIACNFGLTGRQERRKQNLQTRIKTVLERAGLALNHFNSDPRGYAVYLDLPDGSCNSFGGRECGYGIGR
jgi:Ethanolamine utilization protein EutJ (predicted chaperonin)